MQTIALLWTIFLIYTNNMTVYGQPPPASQPVPKNHQTHSFGDQEDIQDQDHLKHHLNGQVNPEQKMNLEQMRYHYFKMHDSNNDNMLDGIELIKAITHSHADPNTKEDKSAHVPPRISDLDLERIVDNILSAKDLNKDGFIDFPEFLKTNVPPAKT